MTEFFRYISDVYVWFTANDGWRIAGPLLFTVYIIGGCLSAFLVRDADTWKSSLRRASQFIFAVLCFSLVLTSWVAFAAYEVDQSALSNGCVRIEYDDSIGNLKIPSEFKPRPTYRCPDGSEL